MRQNRDCREEQLKPILYNDDHGTHCVYVPSQTQIKMKKEVKHEYKY